MFLLNISTRPVFVGFSPLYWFFDDKRKSDEKPSVENFKKCYQRKCNENQKPGEFEKRLLVELLGGLGIIGGGAAFLYGKFKDKKILKWIGGILGVSGIGSLITGIAKFIGMDFKNILPKGSKLKNNSVASEPKKKDSANPPETTTLIVPDKSPDKDLSIEPDDPSFQEQASRIFRGFVKYTIREMEEYDHVLQNPKFRMLVTAIGGGWIYSGREALEICNRFINGKLDFETAEGKKYSQLEEDEKVVEYAKVLDIDKDASVEEIKKAYKTKSRYYHPDNAKNINMSEKDAAEMFCRVSEASEYLTKRAEGKS